MVIFNHMVRVIPESFGQRYQLPEVIQYTVCPCSTFMPHAFELQLFIVRFAHYLKKKIAIALYKQGDL